MKHCIPILFAPLLAACQPAPTDAAATQPVGGDACGASSYARLVGQSMGTARFPADVEMRLINPGEMVTMEYIPTRLNVEVDDAGTVTAIRCG